MASSCTSSLGAVSLAAVSGLIAQISDWVFRNSTASVAEIGFSIDVNFSIIALY